MSEFDPVELPLDRFGRVASPCVDICTLNDEDVCLGCWRSIDEICAWAAASDSERRQILLRVAARREAGDD